MRFLLIGAKDHQDFIGYRCDGPRKRKVLMHACRGIAFRASARRALSECQHGRRSSAVDGLRLNWLPLHAKRRDHREHSQNSGPSMSSRDGLKCRRQSDYHGRASIDILRAAAPCSRRRLAGLRRQLKNASCHRTRAKQSTQPAAISRADDIPLYRCLLKLITLNKGRHFTKLTSCAGHRQFASLHGMPSKSAPRQRMNFDAIIEYRPPLFFHARDTKAF